jgi:S-sulfosulfanyl-L-cysteine sulfohydrolase
MDISRRDFFYLAVALGLSASSGEGVLTAKESDAGITYDTLMDEGFTPTGDVTLLHMCDWHAHLKPLFWREPSTLLSARGLSGLPGFLCGNAFRKYYGISEGSIDAYFDTYFDFERLAHRFGRMGGFAYIKTVIDRIREERGADKCLLLDSGDTWQGTAIGLKTGGEAIVKAQNMMGVDVMVGHWEFTYGKEQVLKLAGSKETGGMLNADFVSQNISDERSNELIYRPYVVRKVGGAKIGVLGQSFPYTKATNPRNVDGWAFGLRLDEMQRQVNELKSQCDVVVLLSHDGFSLDQEVARRVKGIDILLSGHTHDPAPRPLRIGETLIVISGSHGKYVSRLDLDIKSGKLRGYSYKLIPIATNLIPAHAEAQKFVEEVYAPYEKELSAPIGRTESLLYKRDTFYSTFDNLIGEAVQQAMDCDIVLTPGYRWGTTLLPGEVIRADDVYDVTAITYPEVYTFEMKGEQFHKLLENFANNVFNPDPIYQQGGDMARLFGMTYEIEIGADLGKRIRNIVVGGKPLDPSRDYLISSWGSSAHKSGINPREGKIKPVYEVVIEYIKRQRVVKAPPESNVTILDFKNNTCPEHSGLREMRSTRRA